MKQTIAIAISGGIDSLVSAFLLKQQGFDLFGVHFYTGFEGHPLDSLHEATQKEMDYIKDQLDIPIKVIDLQKDFKTSVVDYFVNSYLSGITPNPCLVCNPKIKFGKLLEIAEKEGAHKISTGHYAKITMDEQNHFHLLRGKDDFKEQSYFLSFLNQKQLSKTIFPLGDLTKPEVRKIAAENNLVPSVKEESQDICFIKGDRYSQFLNSQPGFSATPGKIVNTKGDEIGEHNGLHNFTIGQRKGLNCPASEPYYVVRLDLKNNHLVVGFRNETLSSECRVRNINWLNKRYEKPLKVSTCVRYSSKKGASTLIPLENNSALIKFDEPQFAITPGQGAVFYINDEVIGAGFIE